MKVSKKKQIPSDNVVNKKMSLYKDAISTIYQENIDNCIKSIKLPETNDKPV